MLGTIIFIFSTGAAMQGFYLDPPFATPAGVKGQPFQARYEHTTLKRLPGGRVERRHMSGSIFRAADGRSRRDVDHGDADAAAETLIHDPASQKVYFLDAVSKTFISVSLSEESESIAADSSEEASTPAPFAGDDLGRKSIDGLTCRGYRLNGSDGRTVEYWVSEELSEVVFARDVNSEEENTLRMFDIRSVEPDDRLFTIPAGYEEVIPAEEEPGRVAPAGTSRTRTPGDASHEALMEAAATGDARSLKAVLDAGVDVNARDEAGNTALMYAASGRRVDVVQALLDAGAEANAKGGDGSTPIIHAALAGRADIVRALLARGADVNAKNDAGLTAIKMAADRRHAGVTRLLTGAGAADTD